MMALICEIHEAAAAFIVANGNVRCTNNVVDEAEAKDGVFENLLAKRAAYAVNVNLWRTGVVKREKSVQLIVSSVCYEGHSVTAEACSRSMGRSV
jgi:hypothetical protein